MSELKLFVTWDANQAQNHMVTLWYARRADLIVGEDGYWKSLMYKGVKLLNYYCQAELQHLAMRLGLQRGDIIEIPLPEAGDSAEQGKEKGDEL